MRRSDREVGDFERAKALFLEAECCRLGFYDDGEVYMVPLSYGCVFEDGRITLYFHGAAEGRKARLIENSPRVGFELDCGFSVAQADTACAYSAFYRSIIGAGTVSFVRDAAEKRRGLDAIMTHYTEKCWQYPDAQLDRVCVFKLDVDSFSCKEHRR